MWGSQTFRFGPQRHRYVRWLDHGHGVARCIGVGRDWWCKKHALQRTAVSTPAARRPQSSVTRGTALFPYTCVSFCAACAPRALCPRILLADVNRESCPLVSPSPHMALYTESAFILHSLPERGGAVQRSSRPSAGYGTDAILPCVRRSSTHQAHAPCPSCPARTCPCTQSVSASTCPPCHAPLLNSPSLPPHTLYLARTRARGLQSLHLLGHLRLHEIEGRSVLEPLDLLRVERVARLDLVGLARLRCHAHGERHARRQ